MTLCTFAQNAANWNIRKTKKEAEGVCAAFSSVLKADKSTKSELDKKRMLGSQWSLERQERGHPRGKQKECHSSDQHSWLPNDKKALAFIGMPPFQELQWNSTCRNEKGNDQCKRLLKEKDVSKSLATRLIVLVSSSQPPKFYRRGKLRKDSYPLRPIVCVVDSCAYKMAKFVARVLALYSQGVRSFLHNSGDLVEQLSTLKRIRYLSVWT